MKINKKLMSMGLAGLVAVGVLGIVSTTGSVAVSAHDPVEDHEHPHVEPVAEVLTMEDRFRKAFEDAGYTNYEVKCDSFSGSLGASADGMLMAESGSRVFGEPWSYEQDMSEAAMRVEASAEAEVCAAAGVKHSVFGDGF